MDNPREAAAEFLRSHDEFVLERPVPPFNEGSIADGPTYWPGGWLRRCPVEVTERPATVTVLGGSGFIGSRLAKPGGGGRRPRRTVARSGPARPLARRGHLLHRADSGIFRDRPLDTVDAHVTRPSST